MSGVSGQGVRWASARTQSTFPLAVERTHLAFQGLRRAEGEEPSIGRRPQWNQERVLQERVRPCQARGVLPGRQHAGSERGSLPRVRESEPGPLLQRIPAGKTGTLQAISTSFPFAEAMLALHEENNKLLPSRDRRPPALLNKIFATTSF